ncbi:MAG: hypothetical protein AABX16_01720 [Nanoarchaeota archaeon]
MCEFYHSGAQYCTMDHSVTYESNLEKNVGDISSLYNSRENKSEGVHN